MGRRRALLLFGLLFAFLVQAETRWTDTDPQGETRVHLYFFWSQNCPHCLEAHPFIDAIPKERPWVVLHALEVSRSRENSQRFEDMAQALGQEVEGVPAFIYCGAMVVGWGDAERSGGPLLNGLDACRRSGGSMTSSGAERAISLPGFGELDPRAMSLPVLTVIIASLGYGVTPIRNAVKNHIGSWAAVCIDHCLPLVHFCIDVRLDLRRRC